VDTTVRARKTIGSRFTNVNIFSQIFPLLLQVLSNFVYGLPSLKQPTMFLQQDKALPHSALAFLNKASQQMVVWMVPSSLGRVVINVW